MYDIVANPIPRSGFFATPSDFKQLTLIVEALSPEEKALVYPYMMMALNCCHKAVEDQILSKEVFAQ